MTDTNTDASANRLNLNEILDLQRIRPLFKSFSECFNVASALLDLDGTVLIEEGFQSVCKHFHRVNSTTAARCLESDTALANAIQDGHSYNVYRCRNGLVDVAVPLIVEGSHVGNLFIGQFFFEAPDLTYFTNQGRAVGFDNLIYLDSVKQVPVISEEYAVMIMRLFTQLTEQIAFQGIQSVQLKQSKKDVEQALAVKQRFLANMSHEIRTPMNGLLGMLSLLKEEPLNDKCANFAQKAHGSATRLLHLLDDILEVSRLESDKFVLASTSFSIEELVNEIVMLYELNATEKNIDLRLCMSESVAKQTVQADKTRIGQVFSNLLSNAVKFTPANGAIEVSVELLTTPSAAIEIKVADTGPGIDIAHQQDIFEPFKQADNTIIHKYGGTGLGLTICKDLCKRMNGSLSLESELGSGSKFTVNIPVSLLQGDNETKIDGDNTQSMANVNVLLVDVSRISLELTSTILSAQGCKVDTASDCATVINKLNHIAYDLVLFDTELLSRFDESLAVQLPRDRLADVTLIAWSNNPEIVPSGQQYKTKIAPHLLGKPLNLDELMAVLRKVGA